VASHGGASRAGAIPQRVSARGVAELERTLREDFDRNIKLRVETATSLLQGVADRASRGELTEEQARKAPPEELFPLDGDDLSFKQL